MNSIDKAVVMEPVTWRDFVQLAKPGIIFSNLITAFGGFWVASRWDIDWALLVFMIIGTILVIGSGCVLNNYLDRDMDTKMARTKKRALPTGKMEPNVVLWYGIVMGIVGMSVLWFLVTPLSALLGLLGLFVYVWIYTAWFKRTSVWSTVVGAISGAVPPIIGYCAVNEQLDAGAWILFAILFLWQMPHFWALGIRRMEEYRAAGFPLLPVVRGSFVTKISMMRYVVLLVPTSALLYLYGYVGMIYLVAAIVMGIYWAYLCLKGFSAKDEEAWAKKTFIFSINYLTILFLIIVIDTVHV
ncbi:protoheme IX farnesyltransferase [Paenibacillus psychroresistens]|uniref:Protoheme IX farnesyltransferase n=2 Tax=Paenibacillus psychroresistens TaxID=1778678 RepID=A0A6B8RWI7_9BACL|nr:heme o synthase [Paenibacillus psychroresistens]QGR00006.1 protoheme IX farnesyltransferase [Paenibacillus psychroresistens]